MLKEESPPPDSSRLSVSSRTGVDLRAAQRLADYPKRVERLKRLWIDVNGGGQWFNETRGGTPTRRNSTPSRRSGSPAASPREPAASRPAAREASPRAVASEAPRAVASEPARAVAREPARVAARGEPRPKREARRTPSPARGVAREGSPARAVRASPAAPKRAPAPVRGRPAAVRGIGPIAAGGPLTRRQIEELMSRDLTPEDYELLCMLDEGVKKKSLLSAAAASALPQATGTAWVNEECRICLCALEEDEDVRMLPTCGHFFHACCAERWLSSSKNTCPLCGQVEAVQEKVVQAFGQFDKNNDGLVHMTEMRQVLFKLDPNVWTDEAVNTLFQSVDVNQDGKIDTKEFVNWIFKASAGGEQQMLRGTLNI